MKLATQSDERELDCDNGHAPCMCAGRLECHNCSAVLPNDYFDDDEPEALPSNDGLEVQNGTAANPTTKEPD